MFEFLRWIHVKHDSAPGSLVYAGAKREFVPHVTLCTYNEQNTTEKRLDPGEAITLADGHVNFIRVVGIHDSETIKAIGATMDFPNLALEDVMNTGQRPKFVWADDETGFIVMRNVDAREGSLASEQVSLFWRDNLVVVFMETESEFLDGVLARIRKGRGRIRNGGSTYLLSAILDSLVDRNMVTLARFSELAETIETKLDRKTTDVLLGQLYELKREVILLRNLLIPIREIFKGLMREDAEIPDSVLPYLRDTAGHHEQAVDGVTALHDILKSMIDYQVSLIGMHTNRVMQFLTIIATIFIPLTFIAGVYGMNFEFMPELKWRYGYFIVLGIMGVTAIAMLYYFLRKRFL
ncbi:MAG: magnesium/cobalt transporter CorA [Pseudodesulfovibrio sp.]|nr:magnesium/cobalt transporter CorA [Pseudodesulfovibrio sp.]